MGTFTPTAPAVLRLEPWEEVARATAVAASGSPSPVPFAALPPLDPYTHLGHAAQYGKGRRNGRTVRLIVLHVTDVDGTALGAASYDARRPDLVSATAFAGPNGELVYDVAEANRPYTTGRWNDESLALEIVGHDEWTTAQWHARPRQLEGIVRWLVATCRRHQVPAVWLDAAAVALGASPQGATPVQGVNRGITDHLAANLAARALGAPAAGTAHVCVGPGLRVIVLGELIPEAARRLAGGGPTPPPTPEWSAPMSALHMAEPEVRIVDTRVGLGMFRPAADTTFEIPIPGEHAPTAAVLTVTVVNPAGPGFLALWGEQVGGTSKLNFAPADPSPQSNTTLVAVGRNSAGAPVVRGSLRFASSELIVDLVGVIA